MTSPAETKIQRKNTAAFIAIRPTAIVLIPQARVRTSTGGFSTVAGTPRDPQTFRIIDQSSGYMPEQGPQRTIDGVERTVEYMLLGNYDASMDTYDFWTDGNGDSWQLTELFPDNGYERRALVVKHG